MLRNFQVFIPIRGSDSGTIAACERPAPLADLRATIPLVVLFRYEHLAPVELAGLPLAEERQFLPWWVRHLPLRGPSTST